MTDQSIAKHIKQEALREESLAYWSGRAQAYSASQLSSFDGPKRDTFAAVVEHYIPQLDRQVEVLDLGCGSGFLTMILAQAGCRITATDFSQEMLDEAAANVASISASDQVSFLRCAAQELPFEEERFDMVVSRNVTWVLEDVDKVYAHVMRVLRPGGVFVNMDAAYGQAFRAADERGETPTHATQSIDQLLTRNAIARELAISQAERPAWDIAELLRLGARTVKCHANLFDFSRELRGLSPETSTGAKAQSDAPMFALAAWK